jgi:hypothetical protein
MGSTFVLWPLGRVSTGACSLVKHSMLVLVGNISDKGLNKWSLEAFVCKGIFFLGLAKLMFHLILMKLLQNQIPLFSSNEDRAEVVHISTK